MPSTYINKTNNINHNYLVLSNRLTKAGIEYLKILNVYSKALKRLNRSY
jgi:hypothetical protein